MSGNNDFKPSAFIGGLEMTQLLSSVDLEQKNVMAKLNAIQSAKSSISIADMFQMQMLMNKLSQLSEMSSSLISASNTAIRSMNSGIKGQ